MYVHLGQISKACFIIHYMYSSVDVHSKMVGNNETGFMHGGYFYFYFLNIEYTRNIIYLIG